MTIPQPKGLACNLRNFMASYSTMKFDSTILPLLPTPEQLSLLNDALVSAEELHQIYEALLTHPSISTQTESSEVFRVLSDQVSQDVLMLSTQIEDLTTNASAFRSSSEMTTSTRQQEFFNEVLEINPYGVIPDLQRPGNMLTTVDLIKKAVNLEVFFKQQLEPCLEKSQLMRQIKLELQLKMSILATDQRHKLLSSQYSATPTALINNIARKTTRLLSGVFKRDKQNLRKPKIAETDQPT